MLNNQDKIQIEVTFAGYLKQYTGHREPQTLDIANGSTVSQVISHYQVPENLIKAANVNGYQQELTYVLQHDDKVVLQPVLLGG